RALGGEPRAAGRGESVRAHALLVLGHGPLGLDELLSLESMERGIDRAGVDLEHAARGGVDHLNEAIAVARTPAQRLKDDEVERALEDLDAGEGRLFVALDHVVRLEKSVGCKHLIARGIKRQYPQA